MPSTKRKRAARQDARLALNKRLGEIRSEIARLKRERLTVRRDEFAEMTQSLRQLQKNTDDLALQFTRIAQMQADIDAIKRVLSKAKMWDGL